MFLATAGVNTHKGAIFTMGILCGAAGRLWKPDNIWNEGALFREVSAMTAGAMAEDLIRGGEDGARDARERVAALLKHSPQPDREQLEALDDWFMERNLSPGGCADLLAAVYFAAELQNSVLRWFSQKKRKNMEYCFWNLSGLAG